MNVKRSLVFVGQFLIIAAILVGTISIGREPTNTQIVRQDGCQDQQVSWWQRIFSKAQAAFFQSLPNPETGERDPFRRGLILPACGNALFVEYRPDAMTITVGQSITFTAEASDIDLIDSANQPGPCTLSYPSFPSQSFFVQCFFTYNSPGVFGPYTLTVCDTDDSICDSDTSGPITVNPDGGRLPPEPQPQPLLPAIRGDIYAFGIISGLTVRGPAVVSSGSDTPPSITQVGDERVWRVTGYTPRLVSSWKDTMTNNMTRLLRERARQRSDFPTGINMNPDNRLGGEVWLVNEALQVAQQGPITVSRRGTVIVTSGSVVIHNNVDAVEPIGIVLLGGGQVQILPGVTSLTNVNIYAPDGTIRFLGGGGVLTATGAFIAQTFEFGPRQYSITYSTNVALKPPPGFVSFILPTILERAP